ncbi:Ornithine cyclodeaminase [Pseudomonas fluorescens]|nr:Ornithine cyclodeaminase [Pseudomonas fluorescens]
MPVSDASLYAFKYVNGHPKNTHNGMLTVMAFGALGDVDTGKPVLLSEMTLTTAIRTAATSALAARYLARPDSRRMALIGNGSQSEFQALAFHTLLGITEISLYDIDPAATAKLVANLRAYPAIQVTIAKSVAQAVRGADIVTTVTADKAYATILTPEMIEPGMHLNAVGGDCPGKTELHRDIVERARVMVEYEPQSRIEGEIQQMPADSPVIEFWKVVNGQTQGRQHAEEVTLFDSVGFAIEDYSALRYVLDVARTLNIGSDIQLVPELQDPKNLFSLLLPSVTADARLRA